jgi:hypothetical protein
MQVYVAPLSGQTESSAGQKRMKQTQPGCWTNSFPDVELIRSGASTMSTLAVLGVLIIAVIAVHLPHRPQRARRVKSQHVRF